MPYIKFVCRENESSLIEQKEKNDELRNDESTGSRSMHSGQAQANFGKRNGNKKKRKKPKKKNGKNSKSGKQKDHKNQGNIRKRGVSDSKRRLNPEMPKVVKIRSEMGQNSVLESLKMEQQFVGLEFRERVQGDRFMKILRVIDRIDLEKFLKGDEAQRRECMLYETEDYVEFASQKKAFTILKQSTRKLESIFHSSEGR